MTGEKSKTEHRLPLNLDEVLPRDALQRIGEVGLIGFLAEYVRERVEGEPALQWDPAFLEGGLPFLSYVLRYFDAVFGLPGIGKAARRAGAMPANQDNASEALAAGAAVLVYPGGDHAAFRPWTDRNRIDFGGRKGFVNLALRERVPVVPVISHGAHESVVVIARGASVKGALGFDRLRTTVMPLVWQLPWGLSIPFVPGIPMPVKISMQICPPLDWSHYGPDAAEDTVAIDRCYEEITGVMQTTLDRLADEHPYPLMERLRALLPGAGR